MPLNMMCQEIIESCVHPVMESINFTTPGIDKMLCGLNPNKAQGPDGIKPLVLKQLHLTIAPFLQVLFSRSYEEGVMPSDWRKANVTPIYKKGHRDSPANYRPISLTCIASKVMEHVVVSSMMSHLEGNHILHPRQHGFRTGLSCETQLSEFTHDLMKSLHEGQQTDVAILDLAKAFDKVPHNKLIYKLRTVGVDRRTADWIGGFLRDRSQRVVLDGEASEVAPVTSGVPQGSVVGPALFLVFINDLAETLTSQVRLFADDTVLFRQVSNVEQARLLQQDLDKLSVWEKKWQMAFHPKKCQVLRISRSRKPFIHTYNLHGETLESADEVKYLGLTISADIKWNSHVTNVSKKANSKLAFLRRNLRVASPRLKEQLYKTVVRSNMEYVSAVWDPHERKYSDMLEKVQRRAARWVLNRHHNTSSVTSMLHDLQWPLLEQRRAQSRLTLLYKIHHRLVAIPPPPELTPTHIRYTRYTDTNTYMAIQTRTNYYRYSLFPLAVTQWNALPVNIRISPTLSAFKAQVATLEHVRPF